MDYCYGFMHFMIPCSAQIQASTIESYYQKANVHIKWHNAYLLFSLVENAPRGMPNGTWTTDSVSAFWKVHVYMRDVGERELERWIQRPMGRRRHYTDGPY